MTNSDRTGLRVGHVWIDAVTLQGALERIAQMIEGGQGGSVFTPNVDHVVNVERSARLREAYDTCSLSLVDGQPLIWASRLLGAPLPEKISGSDLVPALLELSKARGYRVYLLGGAGDVANEAAKLLRSRGIDIVGTDASKVPMDASPEDAAIVQGIVDARAQLVLVALGNPKQEYFIQRCGAKLNGAVCLGIGGALDFVTGRVRRAPRWMQRSGLEWLFRLAQEPRRLAYRYLVNDPLFLVVLARSLATPRRRRVLRQP